MEDFEQPRPNNFKFLRKFRRYLLSTRKVCCVGRMGIGVHCIFNFHPSTFYPNKGVEGSCFNFLGTTPPEIKNIPTELDDLH